MELIIQIKSMAILLESIKFEYAWIKEDQRIILS